MIDAFFEHYGYLAVFVGSLLEGETIVAMAGLAAQQGHMSLGWTMAIAFLGGTLGDMGFFWAGRHQGRRLLSRIPGGLERAAGVERILRRHDAILVVGIRFMYGLRIIGPCERLSGSAVFWL
jgi:membrane protein DedA with SNARE-associated domain